MHQRLDLPHVEAFGDDALRHRYRIGHRKQRARVAGR